MESSTILTADILDILFDGRNKEYGAYDLRRTYRQRLTVSIGVMLSVICMLFIGFAFAGKKTKADPALFIKDHELIAVTIPEKPAELLPPPPPKKLTAPPPPVQTVRATPPVIVPDDQVKPDEKPPVNADLDNVKIGTITQDGELDNGTVVAPPGDGNVIVAPKKDEEDWNKTFAKVEIESEYPGGPSAWQRFLRKNLRFPDEAADAGVEGFVVVQFIVDVEGNVSDVVIVSGPKELQAEAIRVIKKSGKWTPAIQNGHKVKSYKKQPLGFKLGTE